LQQALLEQNKEKKRHNMNPFETLRKQILDFYNSTFTRILSLNDNVDSTGFHPMNYVFHEVFYFKECKENYLHQNSQKSLLTERLHGMPRFALQKALQFPNFYLTSNSQFDGDSENYDPASLPDLTIAYKLYLENGRYINLFDWLRCWITIVTNGAEEHAPNSKNKLEVNPKLQARFSRCVSELQFLGFIRPSKRKTDHVEKLTWN
jgi:origin recognition complex subunit 3